MTNNGIELANKSGHNKVYLLTKERLAKSLMKWRVCRDKHVQGTFGI